MRKYAEKVLATTGDQAVYPSGQAVFSDPPSNGKPPSINVLPGQLVVYDPTTNLSVGNTTTVNVNKRLVFGVGRDLNGNGMSDTLDTGFAGQMYGKTITDANAKAPACATPHVVDLLFKCTDFDNTYTVNIAVEDNRTQNQYAFNKRAVYSYSVDTSPQDCDDCSSTHQAQDLACKLVDAINGISPGVSVLDQSRFVSYQAPEMTYEAVRLSTTSLIFCLDPVSGACNTCDAISNLKGITIEGVNYPFTNNVDPGDATQTLMGQLPYIVQQINDAFVTAEAANPATFGHAVLTKGAGFCCSYRLEINTCSAEDDVDLYDDQDAVIEPCATTTPLLGIPIVDNCPDCPPVAAGTENYPAGIRLIAKEVPLVLPGGDYPPNPPIGYYGRKLEIYPVKGFETGSTFTREANAMTLPENIGYYWKAREYYGDSHQGTWGNQDAFNRSEGPLGLPSARSAASNTTVNGYENYCSYIIQHGSPYSAATTYTSGAQAFGRTVILIPSGDTTTQTDFEALINNYLDSVDFDAITCGGVELEIQ